MPGSGKSTVGRQLARRLDVPFFDSDVEIENQVGCPIRVLFEREGEPRFRKIEESVIAEIVAKNEGVLATGGGVVLSEANRRELHEKTTVIYLRSSPEELFRRLRYDTKRPLLQVADPLARLRELYLARNEIYMQVAHFVIETGRPSMPMLVNTILTQLELAGLIDPFSIPSTVDPLVFPPVHCPDEAS